MYPVYFSYNFLNENKKEQRLFCGLAFSSRICKMGLITSPPFLSFLSRKREIYRKRKCLFGYPWHCDKEAQTEVSIHRTPIHPALENHSRIENYILISPVLLAAL
jgi:hypothetical protein